MTDQARPRIGLALGSGGARGWSHIGALKALRAAGVEPDIICGASMGALVGAAYASGALDALERLALGMTRFGIARMFDVNLSAGGLIEGGLVEEMLKEVGCAETFSDIDLPFVAVASDLFAGTEVWLRSGNLIEAVRASIAIPGIFSPMRIDDRWLMDGGMTNPVPVSVCRSLGADVVIAIDPNSRMHAYRHRLRAAGADGGAESRALLELAPAALRPLVAGLLTPRGREAQGPGYFAVLSASIDLMTDQVRRIRMAADPPHLIVSPDVSDHTILDFHRADEAIAEGERAMKRQLENLSELLDIGR